MGVTWVTWTRADVHVEPVEVSAALQAGAQASLPHPRPKNAPAEERKDNQPVRLSPLSLCYDYTVLCHLLPFSHKRNNSNLFFLNVILFPVPHHRSVLDCICTVSPSLAFLLFSSSSSSSFPSLSSQSTKSCGYYHPWPWPQSRLCLHTVLRYWSSHMIMCSGMHATASAYIRRK